LPDSLAIWQHHREHQPRSRITDLEITPVPVQDLVLGLRAAEVGGHLRCIRHQQEAEIGLRPRLKPDRWRAIAHAADASPRR
jgi:hypothetical protein